MLPGPLTAPVSSRAMKEKEVGRKTVGRKPSPTDLWLPRSTNKMHRLICLCWFRFSILSPAQEPG